VRKDIADAATEALAEHSSAQISIVPALGPDARLVEVLAQRLGEVGYQLGDLVVLAVAGSSDARAQEESRMVQLMLEEQLGHSVELAFLSAAERALHHTPPSTRPELARDVEDLRWCEAIVFVYPTWWAGLPAMLKGWIDRTWMNEVAWVLPAGANTIRPRLTNITRLVAVTTHGSSKFVNALQGEPGKRIITRSIRVMCNRWCRARWIAQYGLDKSTAQDRQHHLETVGQRVVHALR
jgi:putative NADPH-quinone reductase